MAFSGESIMDLFIIRHAWAGQRGDPKWPDDTQRPLTLKGRDRFAKMIDSLSTRGMEPSLVATSPMIRCLQTAETLAENLLEEPVIVKRDELLPNGDLSSLLSWTILQAEKNQQIAWVGHSPDVEQITASLIGQSESSIRFAKGAIACVRFIDTIDISAGELRWFVTAKVLNC